MTNTNPVSDLAQARAQRAQRVSAAAKKVVTHDATEQAVKTTASKEDASDIASNPIYQIIEDGALDNDSKIAKISEYLTAKENDYPEARKRFAEFEAYYAYCQSENMAIDIKGIDRLVEEVQGSLKPAVESIATNLTTVQTKVKDSKAMLNVLREARQQGRSLEELTTAVRENARLVEEIGVFQTMLDRLNQTEQGLTQDQKTALQEKSTSEKGFFNSLKRLAGPDKEIAETLAYLKERMEAVKAEITETTAQKTAKEAERNEKLESGPLLILRTVDATEKGYSQTLVEAAKSGLALIEDAKTAVNRLIKRTAFSETQAREINLAIARAAVRDLILRQTVKNVSTATHDQGEQLDNELIANAEAIATAKGQEASTIELEVKKLDLDQKRGGAREYDDVLGRISMRFDKDAANSTGAQAQAEQLNELIQQEKDVLTSMASEALPTTTRALRLTLNQALALHTHEIGGTVRELINNAREISAGSMADLVGTQHEMHVNEVADIELAMRALDESAELMTRRLEEGVQESAERLKAMGDLKAAAEGLTATMDAASKTRPGIVRNAAADAAPAA